MQIHQLKSTSWKKSRKRVGRGGKKGTYSGRGMKGQKSRAGRKPRAGFAGGDTSLIKRLPKKRGQIGKTEVKKGAKLFRLKTKPTVFNLADFNRKFFAKDGSSFNWPENEVVSPKNLLKRGLISRIKTRVPQVKILGVGKLKKKLKFSGIIFSKSAREKLGIKEKKKIAKKKFIPRKKIAKKVEDISEIKTVKKTKKEEKKEIKKPKTVSKTKPVKKEVKKKTTKQKKAKK